MTTTLLADGALLDEIAAAIQRHGRPLFALFTTYTFDAHLFASQFLPVLCGEYGEDDRKVGLLVVCDSRMYAGHSLGPWVSTWPGSELFHPKVALLIFSNATLLLAGSGNLTYAGQYLQIEVMGKETWNRPGLPKSLVPLVAKLEGPLPRALSRLKKLTSQGFACSLESSFAKRLKRGRADKIVVISPYFDARESAEADDLGFIVQLVKHHEPESVHLVIPVEHDTGKNRTPRIFVDRKILDFIGSRLRLYGINSAEARPLHAKLIAIYRNDRVRLLFGSANATMAGMTRKNVEAGWFTETTQSEFKRWINRQNLFKQSLDPKAVLIGKEERKSVTITRSPLLCARLNEVDETLTLVWRNTEDAATTRVYYDGNLLRHRNNVIRPFHCGRDWFVCTRNRTHGHPSFAPIEIDRECAGVRRSSRTSDESAEDLLKKLVAGPQLESLSVPQSLRRDSSGRNAATIAVQDMTLFKRVRQLADAMATARRNLCGELPQRMATIALLVQIARAHNPTRPRIKAQDALWRYWVRIEVARVLSCAQRSKIVIEARRNVNRLLAISALPLEIRTTAKAIFQEVAP